MKTEEQIKARIEALEELVQENYYNQSSVDFYRSRIELLEWVLED